MKVPQSKGEVTLARLPGGMMMCGVSALALCATTGQAFAVPVPQEQRASDAGDTAQETTPQSSTTDQQGNATSGTAETNSETAGAAGDIIVTGIRQSLKTAQSLKKNSEVSQDSISSEDIGSLPDRSITEALQRVPGVSINRFAAGNDPDHFSVQGSGVVVRGLTYTRSELNGRDTFTANNGRGLSFADVPAELVGGVDVFKSASADMIEGGIAGTINLRTRVPFDSNGLVIAGTLENSYSDLISKSAPTVSVLLSNRWSTGIGEFGLLGSFVRSQLYARADAVQISNYGNRILAADGTLYRPTDIDPATGAAYAGQTVYVPRGAVARSQEFDRLRYGYSAAAQWRSNDGAATATFQFLRSDSREAWTEHVVEIATDNVTANGDSRPLPGTTFSYDDRGVFTDGIFTGPSGNDGNGRAPLFGLQSNNIARSVDQRFITDDYGANFKWKVSDRLGINLDYQHVKSTVRNTDLSFLASSFQNAELHLNGEKVPTVDFLPVQAGAQGNSSYFLPPHQDFLDPYNSYYRAAMDHLEDSDGNEDAAKVDLDYSFGDDSWINSVRAGYRYADRKNTARFSTYNWGVLSEIWGNGGPVYLDQPVDGVQGRETGGVPGPQEGFFFDNFFRGNTNSPAAPGRPFYPTGSITNYDQFQADGRLINSEWQGPINGCGTSSGAGWVPLAQRCGVVAGTPYMPGEINPVTETTNSGYAEIRFGHSLGGALNFNGNAGLRYVNTKRVASGVQAFPFQDINAQCTPGSTQLVCGLGQAVLDSATAFQNGVNTPIAAKLRYDYYLPSVNLKLETGGGLQFRAAFNQSIAPPDFGVTRAFYNVALDVSNTVILANGAPTAIFSVGNPYLKPIKADNYDLSAEWYFSSVGSLTLALFKKDLHGVVTNGTQVLPFTNAGQTFNGIVTTPVNSDQTGRIKGLEVGYQQTYSFLPGFLSGLGMNANFTYVDSSGVANSTLNASNPNVSAGNISNVDTSRLPLQGLSKYTFNIVPFYERNGIELRGAYSWRSRYLLTTRDEIVPFAPIYSESIGQLDASVFYNINDHIKMGFQGVNLLNTVQKTSQVINNDLVRAPRSFFVNDRRYTFSIRAKFGK